MCGICGLIRDGGLGGEDQVAVRSMMLAMRHRGPDSEGFFFDGSVAVGMRRLSIIDLSGGEQPIFNTACIEQGARHRRVGIIFNGEIYNFKALRSELMARGHRFSTNSDTETIVHAYEQWGPRCVDYLRGMFTFAILDYGERAGQVRAIFLARDRLGIKPLYYYERDGLFLFASEVRSLLASGLVSRRLSLEGVASYLAYGSVQEPLTLIEGVYSLPPGHYMTVDVDRSGGERIAVQPYWQIPKANGEWNKKKKSEHEVVEEIREILRESIRLRMISEVPLGAFLSSGIDSSAIVALMSQASNRPVKAFTIGFSEAQFNETKLAREMAQRCGAEYHEIIVTPQQVLSDLPQALAAMDQPTIDGINTYYVSRATKQAGITVALSGLGGDELFAGYPTFRSGPRLMTLAQYLPTLPSSLLHSGLSILGSDRWRKLAAFLSGDTYFGHPYYMLRALFTPQQNLQLLKREALASLNRQTPWHKHVDRRIGYASQYDPINAISYLECTNYLVSTLLRDADCMSMAHSLEVRVPLIDQVLVEYMMRLPGSMKLNGKSPKHLLVKALDGNLHPQVAQQKKRTFTFPWRHWLRHELRDEVEQVLSTPTSALNHILDPMAVKAVWEQFIAGRTSWSRVWSLYVLQKWVEREF